MLITMTNIKSSPVHAFITPVAFIPVSQINANEPIITKVSENNPRILELISYNHTQES